MAKRYLVSYKYYNDWLHKKQEYCHVIINLTRKQIEKRLKKFGAFDISIEEYKKEEK